MTEMDLLLWKREQFIDSMRMAMNIGNWNCVRGCKEAIDDYNKQISDLEDVCAANL